jgi:hypothetical protein
MQIEVRPPRGDASENRLERFSPLLGILEEPNKGGFIAENAQRMKPYTTPTRKTPYRSGACTTELRTSKVLIRLSKPGILLKNPGRLTPVPAMRERKEAWKNRQ